MIESLFIISKGLNCSKTLPKPKIGGFQKITCDKASNQTSRKVNIFPEDFDHFEPHLKNAMKRIPALENVGIRKFFNGPEAFTPDTNYLLGETPEVKNFYVCCGFNSIGIQSAGGAGKVTAEWMMNGEVNDDLYSLDIS